MASKCMMSSRSIHLRREGPDIEGVAPFQATIGKDGLIHNLKVISDPPILAEAARGAVETNGVTGRIC